MKTLSNEPTEKSDNQLIAEFMNLCVFQSTDFESLPYHTSWGWLMPVVEKIESVGFVFTIMTSHVAVTRPFDIEAISAYDVNKGDKKIEVVYDVVREFIKWYNLNQITPKP